MKGISYSAVGLALALAACEGSERVEPTRGDLAKRGGSPTVRRSYEPRVDDSTTTNDESNDQPVGHFGTVTVDITSEDSGNTYTLDAEIDGATVERVYFPKGGWVDFYDCEVDEDLAGECEDEEGRWWTFEGESDSSTSSVVDDEENADDEDEQDTPDDESDGPDDDGDGGVSPGGVQAPY